PDAVVNYPGTAFPYLAANLVFTNDSNLKTQVAADGQPYPLVTNLIARSCTIAVHGDTVGVVGVTTPELATLSSPGGVIVLTNVAAEAQAAVHALTNAGLNKIILLAHLQQLENELDLAGRLAGVDILIAGGSHTLLAKPGDRLRAGDTRYGDYPLVRTDLVGRVVYVLNTAANYRYVGRFVADFDAGGFITNVSTASGAYATDDQGVADTGGYPPAPAVTGVVAVLAGIIDAKDGNLFGRTAVYLNGIRESVRTEETNLGDLSADANLYRAGLTDPAASLSLKNGGGIRDSIGAILSEGGGSIRVPPLANPRVGKQDGDVSQLDIENALRFNNSLSILTITAQDLRDAVEWGVAGSGTPGQFPQVGGLEFSFNPTNAPMTYSTTEDGTPTNILFPGERLRSLVARRADGQRDLVVENGALVGDSNRTFRLVTLEYMADGGDRYFALTRGIQRTNLVPADAVKTFTTDGGEQKALADYLWALGECSRPDTEASADGRIQRLNAREDDVLKPGIVSLARAAGVVRVDFSTLPGKSYQAESAPALAGPWAAIPALPPVAGNGYDTNVVFSPGGPAEQFFRLEME
ncbi:MAG TPA: 5'-nucleotidase C-terminal domain-containing protein, partial [Kiritimatiellia bacterium]|nr:5'-nucleotidase C-terminal domain-containing protein [Kiritimatiellia bacterium]